MIIPSIDLMSGKAVQLRQGVEKVLERSDVIELAKYYGRFGEIAVIDLDAAVGNGNNEELIKKICAVAECRVGGGIRTTEKAKRMLANGARKIIIGTAADEDFLSKLPKSRVLVAIDAKDGKVATHGWTKSTNETPKDMVRRFDKYCSGYLYTIVEKEGMMQGTNIDAIKEIRNYFPFRNEGLIKPDFEDYLFISRFGKNISRIMVFHVIKELADKIGLRKTISPHTFRHSFATHLLEGGANLRAIQSMLGHESIGTTEIYTHIDRRKLRDEIINHHPRNNKKSL